VHLVGFITNKFVTMHGHMNVKNFYNFIGPTLEKLCYSLACTDFLSTVWLRM